MTPKVHYLHLVMQACKEEQGEGASLPRRDSRGDDPVQKKTSEACHKHVGGFEDRVERTLSINRRRITGH